MPILTLKAVSECKWDIVSLGEIMLRLDPGEQRIHTTRTFRVWEGGGEYNVARGLKRCFGKRAAVVTAIADNPVGRLLEDLEILDRVGGGDSFAPGLIYGLMEQKTPDEAVNYGAAHGALPMTTPGDTTTVSVKEVQQVMKGGTARIIR